MVKGGVALIARNVTDRATDDLDIRGSGRGIQDLVGGLLDAARQDLGDGLEFTLDAEPTDLVGQDAGGRVGFRLKFTATQGGAFFERVRVDLVAGREPAGVVQAGIAPQTVASPDVAPAVVDLYPIEDHIADKVWASLTTYGRGVQSSRIRDLHDLCTIALRTHPDATPLCSALEEERMRRQIVLAPSFLPPDAWRSRWAAAMRKYPDPEVPADFDEAVSLVQDLVDPILSVTVTEGTWNPQARRWL